MKSANPIQKRLDLDFYFFYLFNFLPCTTP